MEFAHNAAMVLTRQTDDQFLDLVPGAASRTPMLFIPDRFLAPAGQRLWRHDGCRFRQHLSAWQPGFDCRRTPIEMPRSIFSKTLFARQVPWNLGLLSKRSLVVRKPGSRSSLPIARRKIK